MLIETPSHPCEPTNTANVTGSSITEPIPTITMPSGDGVMVLGHGGQHASTAIKIYPYGVGADGTTFNMNLYGWEIVPGDATHEDLWVPVLLAAFTTCTLDSTQPGLAGTFVGATQLFCTAITMTVGNQGISVELLSPGHGTHELAHIVLDTKGARFVEARFGTGGSATSANALWRRM